MKKKQDIQDWRQFELMVSRLEKILKPTHFVFKSPDHLMDFEINETREVDCSIIFQRDGREERISIECRKRGGKQDVTWIEQLATKMKALKLSGTIAVSSKGFSKAAYAKARSHGIILNTYKEVEANFSSDPLTINPVERTWRVLEFQYVVPDECPTVPENLQVSINDRMALDKEDIELIRIIETGQIITFGQIVERALDHNPDLIEGKKERKIKVGFENGYGTIVGFPDEIYLESLIFKVEVEILKKPISNLMFGKYEDANGALVETAQGKFKSEGKNMELEIIFKAIKIDKI